MAFKKRFWSAWVHTKELYSLDLWMENNVPERSIFDIDKIIYNWNTKKIMLLEEKRRDGKIGYRQRNAMKKFEDIFKKGLQEDWEYLGYHFVQFPKGDVHHADYCTLNGEKISLKEFAKFLTF